MERKSNHPLPCPPATLLLRHTLSEKTKLANFAFSAANTFPQNLRKLFLARKLILFFVEVAKFLFFFALQIEFAFRAESAFVLFRNFVESAVLIFQTITNLNHTQISLKPLQTNYRDKLKVLIIRR